MGADLFSTVGINLDFVAANDEDKLLATPASLTVLANLPPGVSEDFVFTNVARLDGSGPIQTLQGTTLERWGRVKKVLAEAWRGMPRPDRPAILSMRLPELDPKRRRLIARMALEIRSMPGGGR